MDRICTGAGGSCCRRSGARFSVGLQSDGAGDPGAPAVAADPGFHIWDLARRTDRRDRVALRAVAAGVCRKRLAARCCDRAGGRGRHWQRVAAHRRVAVAAPVDAGNHQRAAAHGGRRVPYRSGALAERLNRRRPFPRSAYRYRAASPSYRRAPRCPRHSRSRSRARFAAPAGSDPSSPTRCRAPRRPVYR